MILKATGCLKVEKIIIEITTKKNNILILNAIEYQIKNQLLKLKEQLNGQIDIDVRRDN